RAAREQFPTRTPGRDRRRAQWLSAAVGERVLVARRARASRGTRRGVAQGEAAKANKISCEACAGRPLARRVRTIARLSARQAGCRERRGRRATGVYALKSNGRGKAPPVFVVNYRNDYARGVVTFFLTL